MKWASLIRHRPTQHVVFWAVWYGYIFFTAREITGSSPFAARLATALIAAIVLVNYAHFYLLERFFFRRRFGLYAVCTSVLVVLASALFQAGFRRFFEYENSFAQTIISCLVILSIPMAMKFVRRTIDQEMRLMEAREKQRQTELDLLKSQVNPHFLYNTLNNLYALSLDTSQELPNMILALSSLMRYLTHNAKKPLVLRTQEVDFLKHYVALEKMRLVHPERVVFETRGDLMGTRIAPLLFIPLVENCFKHGAHDPTRPFSVHILLEQQNGWVRFFAANTASEPTEPIVSSPSGTGLANIRRRLELLYPQRHRLDVGHRDGRFEAELEVRP